MKDEWVKGLSQAERDEIALGIGNGTLTYPDRQAQPQHEAA